jgi:hypothetical protein
LDQLSVVYRDSGFVGSGAARDLSAQTFQQRSAIR